MTDRFADGMVGAAQGIVGAFRMLAMLARVRSGPPPLPQSAPRPPRDRRRRRAPSPDALRAKADSRRGGNGRAWHGRADDDELARRDGEGTAAGEAVAAG